jgi:hypothetical protein
LHLAKLIKHFKSLQTDAPCVFILRHAEKYIKTNVHEDILQSITPKGRQTSRLLGHFLNKTYSNIDFVKSSPIKRCLETSKAVFPNFQNKIKSSKLLGGDGVYVSDGKLAAQNFISCQPPEEVFFKLLAGAKLPGMRTKEEGSKLLLEGLMEDLEQSSGPGFYVTHDCILAVFLGTLTNIPITNENWPNYLEGICLKQKDNHLYLYWGKSVFDITENKDLLLNV